MRNIEKSFTVTNAKSGNVEFEYTGDDLSFAKLYTMNMDDIVDLGYPEDIIAEYKSAIAKGEFDPEQVPAIQDRIAMLEKFDKDSVVFVNNKYTPALITDDVSSLDMDYNIQSQPLKPQPVLDIEALGYEIQALSNRNGKSRLYLVDDGTRVGSIDYPSNNERIERVRAKLNGSIEMQSNSNLGNALKTVYATALAHSMANDRIAPEKIESLVAKLPEHLQNEYSRRLDGFGSQVEKVVTPEPEHFYLIRSSVKSPRDNTVTSFTNEFVGTAAGLEEYRQDVQRRNSNLKPEYRPVWNEVEKFASEFREQHRTIEAMIQAYKAGTADKAKMKEAFDKFDPVAKDRLEFRLKEENLDSDRFKNDLNQDKRKRINKPKM